MIARAGLFRELRCAYDQAAGDLYQRTAHRARCQWLIGYLLHHLGMTVDLLGPEIHTHGHFGLPAGCRMEGGVCVASKTMW
jgi:hypothetical protein